MAFRQSAPKEFGGSIVTRNPIVRTTSIRKLFDMKSIGMKPNPRFESLWASKHITELVLLQGANSVANECGYVPGEIKRRWSNSTLRWFLRCVPNNAIWLSRDDENPLNAATILKQLSTSGTGAISGFAEVT